MYGFVDVQFKCKICLTEFIKKCFGKEIKCEAC